MSHIIKKKEALAIRNALKKLSPEARVKFVHSLIKEHGEEFLDEIKRNFWIAALDHQLPPENEEDYSTWLLLCGRGFGKSWVGSNYLRARIEEGLAKSIIIMGPTHGQTVRVQVESPKSGILAAFPPDRKPEYNASKGEIYFHNGAIAYVIGGEKFNRSLGNNTDAIWFDELASFTHGKAAFDKALATSRDSNDRKIIITTTPDRVAIIKELHDQFTGGSKRIRLSGGSTFSNPYLSTDFKEEMAEKYAGTTYARQELEGEFIMDEKGPLFSSANINENRRSKIPDGVRVVKSVVAVDPAVSVSETSDLTGISVVAKGSDGHAYVLEDCSGKWHPDQWAKLTIDLHDKYGCSYVIVEKNQGGNLNASNLRQYRANIKIKEIHAHKSKPERFAPVSAKYQQNKVHHVGDENAFEQLESQMFFYSPSQGKKGKSPDRLDALAYAVTDLLINETAPRYRDLTYLPQA